MSHRFSKWFVISILSSVFLHSSILYSQRKPFHTVRDRLTVLENIYSSFPDEQIHPFNQRDLMDGRRDRRLEPRPPFQDDIQHWDWKHNRHFELDRNPFPSPSLFKAQVKDSVWVNFWKVTYTYDAKGYLTEELWQTWMNIGWVNDSKYTYTYDANGNLTEWLFQGWHDENNEWRKGDKWTYAYDVNGNLTEWLKQFWDNWESIWVNFRKYDYTYDSDGNLAEELMKRWKQGAWVDAQKKTYIYDVDGNLTERLFQGWQNNAWVNHSKHTYSYDANGNLAEELWQDWQNNVWENHSKHTYTYDSNGNLTEELWQLWETNVWVNRWNYTYAFDADGNLTESLWQDWNDEKNVWVNQDKVTNTYDSNGNLTESLWQRWGVPLAITDENTLPKDFRLSQNYPNPFNPITTIEFSIPQSDLVSIKVYDILGKEVSILVNDYLPIGNHTINWNGNNQPSGIYFVRMDSGDFTQSRKMLLLR